MSFFVRSRCRRNKGEFTLDAFVDNYSRNLIPNYSVWNFRALIVSLMSLQINRSNMSYLSNVYGDVYISSYLLSLFLTMQKLFPSYKRWMRERCKFEVNDGFKCKVCGLAINSMKAKVLKWIPYEICWLKDMSAIMPKMTWRVRQRIYWVTTRTLFCTKKKNLPQLCDAGQWIEIRI